VQSLLKGPLCKCRLSTRGFNPGISCSETCISTVWQWHKKFGERQHSARRRTSRHLALGKDDANCQCVKHKAVQGYFNFPIRFRYHSKAFMRLAVSEKYKIMNSVVSGTICEISRAEYLSNFRFDRGTSVLHICLDESLNSRLRNMAPRNQIHRSIVMSEAYVDISNLFVVYHRVTDTDR